MLFQKCADSLVIQAPAKLNLFLEILGKRDDGFHELETLMVSVSLYDTLIFKKEETEQIHLQCFDASQCSERERSAGEWLNNRQPSASEAIPDNEENLVMRAARLLQKQTGTTFGVRISLQKRIPMAAGLAGGSSDAAATLAGLNRFWNLDLENEELCHLASQLGSDVPFFLASSPMAVCRGRGELIEPCSFSGQQHFVIARPSSGLSTARVFQHYHNENQTQPKNIEPLLSALSMGHTSKTGQHFFNALQTPARRLNSEIDQLNYFFERESVWGHLMSGSGSACFCMCSTLKEAEKIANRLQAKIKYQTFVASTSF